MISLKQILSFFSNIVLTTTLATTIAFNSGILGNLATSPSPRSIRQPPTQIAMTKNADGKTQKPFGIMSGTGNSQALSDAKTEQFKAKTLEGINNSIGNPNYQPGGKTKGVEKQDSQANKEITDEAIEAMKSER